MAFTTIPRDLNKIKSKLIFNLTKRQLICFGTAAAIGVPTYFLTRGVIGNSAAVLVMMGIMLPLFFISMYEKDGMPAEKVLRNYVRTKIYWSGIRPYKTENFYAILEKEGKRSATQEKTAAKAAGRKHTPVTAKQKGRRKGKTK